MTANATLTDRTAIVDLIAGFANAQDNRDWSTLRALLDDRVRMDISRHLGGVPLELAADEFIDRSRAALTGFVATHHATSNVLVDVQGEEALCRAHVVAYHYLPGGSADYCIMRGFWHVDVRRSAYGWRMSGLTVIRTVPLEGDADIYARAAKAARP